MLIYLFALERSGEGYFHKPIVPSGVLYIPARDVLVQGSRSMDEKERLKKVSYELRRKGVILDDEAVLNAMEDSSGGEIHYLPVKLDKNGNIAGSALLSAEKLGRLGRYIDKLLMELAHEIYAGSTSLNPYRKGSYISCSHCDYADVCHFSENGKPRKFEKVSDNQFWELVGGEKD